MTPDSFSDGGELEDTGAAVERAARYVHDGAAMLDVGGESTRPGASRVPADEQVRRVVPVIRAIRASGDRALAGVPISVDTTRQRVARAALDEGADAINDVSGGSEEPEILELAAQRHAGLVLMHRLVEPGRDRFSDQYQAEPAYAGGVVGEVRRALCAMAERALSRGVSGGSIVLDPGLGFGKSVRQNLSLLAGVGEIASLGYPVLVGASRKSFVGRAGLGRDSTPAERLGPSIAATLAAARGGAQLHRVHDVREHAGALGLAGSLGGGNGAGGVSVGLWETPEGGGLR